jgi:hypothetical protein
MKPDSSSCSPLSFASLLLQLGARTSVQRDEEVELITPAFSGSFANSRSYSDRPEPLAFLLTVSLEENLRLPKRRLPNSNSCALRRVAS